MPELSLSPTLSQSVPTSAISVTEKTYPITILWIFKAPLIMLLISIIAILFGYWFPYLIIAFPFYLIANPLIRANFHYAVDEQYFNAKQGVFSKKQRSLPYGVIQNVLVKQDIFDRLFGLATLSVENAVQAGDVQKIFGITLANKKQQQETVGSSGNKVNIPGLRRIDAEALKQAILQKMKQAPATTNLSGL